MLSISRTLTIIIKGAAVYIVLLILTPCAAWAQETVIHGKVTDAGSGDPIPFVNVVFKGSGAGATTDFDGNYTIKTAKPTDSLMASYIGYKPRTKAVSKAKSQVINFQLIEEVTHLQEVVVKAGENPAFEILRQVVKNRSATISEI